MTSNPASTVPPPSQLHVVNVPNTLTALRLVLALAVFVLIPLHMYWGALVTFVIAASTDWIDGYWARRYGQVTKLGRIFDPFVDKIIICGTFIFLCAIAGSGIAPWVAVLVVGRELLVTAIRSVVEASGGDFSAKWAAKWKMVFQCIAAGASLAALTYGAAPPNWVVRTVQVSVWLAILTTVYSGVEYVVAAARLMRD